MKKYFGVDCDTVLDTIYESEKDSDLHVITQIKIGLHLLFCPGCIGQLNNLRYLESVMKDDFLPSAPDFEESLMQRIYEEECLEKTEEASDAPAGFSFRLWIIIGSFLLLSLSSSFFGMNFIVIADREGLSFLLPVGLTIGLIVTCYGAFFIGSHLKELSNRFRLR